LTVLRSTYADKKFHDQWRQVYRTNPRQLAFDEELYDWLFQKLQPVGSWLDAGCGSGERSFMLARRAGAVLGIDLSPTVLQVAEEHSAALGMGGALQFKCSGLEELSAESVSLYRRDNVHCRGVLMHIPAWREALANVCRLASSNGYVVVFENNSRSLEATFVRLLRRLLKARSQMVTTDGGLEFRSESDGKHFVFRMADLGAIEAVMRAENVTPLFRGATYFLDINRFPAGLRPLIILLNRLWFRGNLPLASGVLVVGRKN
jgi:2-polyprenyl-3-methyl-5-hydroxy-6-metoxy-1,4-benzoquinol methylase